MFFPSKNSQLGSAIYAVVALTLGFGVLFVSLARASLQIWAFEDTEHQLRTKPIEFVITHSDGSTESGNYKLPEIKTLPTSPLYGVKTARNYLWMSLTRGQIDKGKMALLIADKKMTEAQILIETGKSKSGLESSADAIDKLKYAYTVIRDAKSDDIERDQLKSQIIKAGHAYAEVIKKSESKLTEDNNAEYEKIIKDLEKWNEEREQEKMGI